MKGIIFTELLEMAEEKFGPKFVNSVVESVNTDSNGVYTSVGNYDHKELVILLRQMSSESKVSVKQLMFDYGNFLFKKFVNYYPSFFSSIEHPFDFLESVDTYIHKEVLKLYPNAELPKFECKRISKNEMEMIYTSSRRMEDFAHGLIDECLNHFSTAGNISLEPLSENSVRFLVEIR